MDFSTGLNVFWMEFKYDVAAFKMYDQMYDRKERKDNLWTWPFASFNISCAFSLFAIRLPQAMNEVVIAVRNWPRLVQKTGVITLQYYNFVDSIC